MQLIGPRAVGIPPKHYECPAQRNLMIATKIDKIPSTPTTVPIADDLDVRHGGPFLSLFINFLRELVHFSAILTEF